MAGKGGGAWKVAYADFVTAMMAFFMVMWLISQSQQVKEAVAEHFREPTSHGQLLPPLFDLYPRDGLQHEPPKHWRKRTDKNADPKSHPDFATERGSRTRIGTVVLFSESSAELSSSAQESLNETVPLLAGKPQKIELRAHATSRPLPPGSPYPDVWQLCCARSLAVMKHLESCGIPADRMRLSLAGPYEPFTIGTDPEKLRHNSSVEVFLLTELASNLVGTTSEREQRFAAEGGADAAHETHTLTSTTSGSPATNAAESPAPTTTPRPTALSKSKSSHSSSTSSQKSKSGSSHGGKSGSSSSKKSSSHQSTKKPSGSAH